MKGFGKKINYNFFNNHFLHGKISENHHIHYILFTCISYSLKWYGIGITETPYIEKGNL